METVVQGVRGRPGSLVLAFLVMQALMVVLMWLMLFVVFHNAGR